MKIKPLLFDRIFDIVVVLILVGTLTDSIWLNYPLKPLIMATLAVLFLMQAHPLKGRWLVLAAFFFSWTGDILLMMAGESEMLFFAGVGAFFLSQVTYIQVFRKYALLENPGPLTRNKLWIIPFIGYFLIIFGILYPHLEGVMIPVVAIYAISLIGMSMAAFNRLGRSPQPAITILFTGSIFFVLSDSLLAINKFVTELPFSGFLVMSTYMIAQYLIMIGLVRSSKAFDHSEPN